MAEQKKERDIEQVIRYLTKMFENVTQNMERPKRDNSGANKLYRLQSEFAYLINEMTMCPPCLQQIPIAAANELIDSILQQKGTAK